MSTIPTKEHENTDTALAGRKILVVEDEADVRTFLTTLLEDAGAVTIEAQDGDEALEVARREQPDIITLDLSMPGKDGIEAFTELRQDDATEAIPVCVVTGHPEFRKVLYERPVRAPEGYMNKPVDEADLVWNLRRILELRDRKST
jgi:two-component system, OmpR family, phosphate regulon response regulator PhoB